MSKVDNEMNLATSMQSDIISQVVRERDQQLIDLLKSLGHEFENRQELMTFLQTRCQRIIDTVGKTSTLLIDGEAVAQWYDTERLEQDGNTFTITIGDKPQ